MTASEMVLWSQSIFDKLKWEDPVVMLGLLYRVPALGNLIKSLRIFLFRKGILEFHRRGDYYSPLPDIEFLQEHSARIFNDDFDSVPGVDMNVQEQLQLFEKIAKLIASFELPASKTDGWRYFSNNEYYGPACGLDMLAMLLHFKPKKLVEIGSGFSSALILDVSDKFLNGTIDCKFIEFNPNRLMTLIQAQGGGKRQILETRVQDVSLDIFEELDKHDFLIVDSSHVVSAGSDVQHIIFEILPRVRPNVIVHFHDVFWLFEYPKEWITDMGRA